MLRAKFIQARMFKRVIALTESMLGDATLQISEEGLSFGGLDDVNVMLSDIRIEKSAFESYTCTAPFGIDIKFPVLAQKLKVIRDTDTLELYVKSGSDKLELVGNRGGVNEGVQVRIDIFLLSLDISHMEIPEVEYTAVARLPCAIFHRAIDGVKDKNLSCITLTVSSDEVTFEGEGTMSNTVVTVMAEEDGLTTDVERTRKVSLTPRYLEAYAKIGSISKYVTICIPEDEPVLFEFDLPEDDGYIRVHLAPKIDDEDAASDGVGGVNM